MMILRGHEKPVYDLAFSPIGGRLASISMDHLCMWDLHSGELLWRGNRPDFGVGLEFAPDGQWLAVHEFDIGIYDPEKGKRQLSLWIPRGAHQFAIAPNSTQIAVMVSQADPPS